MIKFGTGGFRAIIGEDFTKENIQILSKAMCDKMKKEGVADSGMVIGYDRRFLSKEAMQWAAMVFAKEGIKTKLINKSVPTPVVMFYVMKHEYHYGMMITASHNPAVYNGIKVFTYGGRDADEKQTADIENYIQEITDLPVEDMDYDEAIKAGLIEEIFPLNEYLDSIIDTMNMQAIRDAGLKVAIDPLYGVGDTSLKTILMTARCDVESIHSSHDTLFGGKMPAPTADTLRYLQNYVVDKKCDMGIGTDGDADRIGVIDDQGNYLHANDILVLLYYYLVKYKGWQGPAVRNICTTHTLDRVAEKFGYECYEVPVGFKHISAKMYATDAVIGGESSGGMAVRGHIKGKDGVYASALLVEMVAVTGMKLSEIMKQIREEFGELALVEEAYKFSEDRKASIKKIVLEDKLLPELPYEVEKISYLDGLKVYFKNGGWVSVRFSGTEPLLRLFCEMATKEEANKVANIFKDYLNL